MNDIIAQVKEKYPIYKDSDPDSLTMQIATKYPIYLKNESFKKDYGRIVSAGYAKSNELPSLAPKTDATLDQETKIRLTQFKPIPGEEKPAQLPIDVFSPGAINLPRFDAQGKSWPMQVAAGVGNFALDIAEFMGSPEGLSTFLVPQAAIPAVITTMFAQMPEMAVQAGKALGQKDYQSATTSILGYLATPIAAKAIEMAKQAKPVEQPNLAPKTEAAVQETIAATEQKPPVIEQAKPIEKPAEIKPVTEAKVEEVKPSTAEPTPTPAAKLAPETATTKQPWEMTKAEWRIHEQRATAYQFTDEKVTEARNQEAQARLNLNKAVEERKSLGNMESIRKVMTDREGALERNQLRRDADKEIEGARKEFNKWASISVGRATHEGYVKRALERGESVPPEVLSEYPDLKPKIETPASISKGLATAPPAELMETATPKGPGIVGMGGATPAEFELSKGRPTAMKYRQIDLEREQRGLEPLTKPESVSDQKVLNKAMAKLDQDPSSAERLVDSLLENPRVIEDWENDMLLLRKIDLRNEYEKSANRAAQAYDDGRMEDAVLENEQTQYWSDQLSKLEQASRLSGSARGRALRSLQVMVNEDFSLASLELQKRSDVGFRELTVEERSNLKKVAKDYAEANNQLQKLEEQEKVPKKDLLDAEYQVEKVKKKWNQSRQKDKLANQTAAQKLGRNIIEIPNTMRALLTSYDLSAVFRQGGPIVFGHPIRGAKIFPPMLKAWRSERGAFEVQKEISNRKNYPIYQQSKLYLAEQGEKLSEMEEVFMSRIANKIVGVAASQRAYTTFLNRLRADSFDAMASKLSQTGVPNPIEAKAIANYINVATGRATLPGKMQQAAVGLNTVFFAPRYAISRFQFLLGQPFYKGSWNTRTMIAKEYARYLTGIGLVYALANASGAKIETDPRSTDFLKIKFGNTRIDPMSGLIQATVFMSRLASGKTKTAKGSVLPIRGKHVPFGSSTVSDIVARFVQSKLAPGPGTALNVLSGKDYVGNEVTPKSLAFNSLVPISMQDIYQAMKDQGVPETMAIGMLSILGMGVQTYQTKK